jgi:hypothetical protein
MSASIESSSQDPSFQELMTSVMSPASGVRRKSDYKCGQGKLLTRGLLSDSLLHGETFEAQSCRDEDIWAGNSILGVNQRKACSATLLRTAAELGVVTRRRPETRPPEPCGLSGGAPSQLFFIYQSPRASRRTRLQFRSKQMSTNYVKYGLWRDYTQAGLNRKWGTALPLIAVC